MPGKGPSRKLTAKERGKLKKTDPAAYRQLARERLHEQSVSKLRRLLTELRGLEAETDAVERRLASFMPEYFRKCRDETLVVEDVRDFLALHRAYLGKRAEFQEKNAVQIQLQLAICRERGIPPNIAKTEAEQRAYLEMLRRGLEECNREAPRARELIKDIDSLLARKGLSLEEIIDLYGEIAAKIRQSQVH